MTGEDSIINYDEMTPGPICTENEEMLGTYSIWIPDLTVSR